MRICSMIARVTLEMQQYSITWTPEAIFSLNLATWAYKTNLLPIMLTILMDLVSFNYA